MTPRALPGLDIFVHNDWKKLKGYRIGLLCNQASVNTDLQKAALAINNVLPGHIKALFSPQHGYGGEDQDNMVETPHSFDKDLQVPVFSLYSKTREPTQDMLDLIDVLIIDLQDVGTRVYTFSSTMLNCLKACAKANKMVMILDRPNPLGGEVVEGNLLQPELYSFVGPFSVPMRHGLTMGEMALLFNNGLGIGCDLEVIAMKGWKRWMLWKDTGLRWIMPSPNMPYPDTAMIYPGQVLWEGTNVSEGRGTCRPFELFGAPYFDTRKISRVLDREALSGCYLQEFSFKPTFHKWAGKICRGFFIHIIDPASFSPYFTALSLLQAVIKIHPMPFRWKNPPYEYDYERLPIDLLIGNSLVRRELETGNTSIRDLRERWASELALYVDQKKGYHIY